MNCRELVAYQARVYPSRIRIGDGGEQALGQGAESSRRDLVILEWLAGLGVVDWNQVSTSVHKAAEVTLFHRCGGHRSHVVLRLILSKPVRADVEESAILAVVKLWND